MRFRNKYGDWRDEFVTTTDWRSQIGPRVDPDWPVVRPEFQTKGAPAPEAQTRCVCPCHNEEDVHCGVCLNYWTPPLSPQQCDEIGASLRPKPGDEDYVTPAAERRLHHGVLPVGVNA